MPLLYDPQVARVTGDQFAPITGVPYVEVMKFDTSEVDPEKSITIPRNTMVLNIRIFGLEVRNSGTSAIMTVGDDNDPDGYFTGVDLKAAVTSSGNELTAADLLDFNRYDAAKGAYFASASRWTHQFWYPDGGEIVAAIADTGTNPTTGEHYVFVEMVTIERFS